MKTEDYNRPEVESKSPYQTIPPTSTQRMDVFTSDTSPASLDHVIGVATGQGRKNNIYIDSI